MTVDNRIVRQGDTSVDIIINGWTLSVYIGRKNGSLPPNMPMVKLYKSRFDERKQTFVTDDTDTTPWSDEFSKKLREVLTGDIK